MMKEKYLIGYVSHILNISKDTLRYYDKLGIVSPKKDASNRYRYYTLEDLLTLSYVLVFRDLEIPLEEIKTLIQNNRLDDFNQLLDKQEAIVDSKIHRLMMLKEKVLSFKDHIKTVQSFYGHIRTTYSPAFAYQPTKKEWDAHYSDYLAKMEHHPNIASPVFSTLLSKSLLELDEANSPLSYGISGVIRDLSDKQSISHYIYMPPRPCIHTVICSRESVNQDDLIPIQDYIYKNHLNVDDDILARNIAFEHIDETPIDYYELWIPITNY